jgi:hypothetical protein
MRTIVVVGLGPSAQEAWRELRDHFYTIGVNDVARFHQPDELLILDRKGRFTPERQAFIGHTRARHVWSPHQEWEPVTELPWREIKTRKFTKQEPFDWDGEYIPHYLTSPFAGIGLAYKLGARRIALIGLDLGADHHMGAHSGRINHQLRRAWQELGERDVELLNCSPISTITAIPFQSLGELI